MDEVQKAIKARYSKVHPLVFHRSMEYAKSNGELFDIMEGMPSDMPVIWNHELRIWEKTELLQAERFKKKD